MFLKSHLKYPLLISLLTVALVLAGCNLPAEDLLPANGEDQQLDLQAIDSQDPIFAAVEFSELTLKGPQCMPDGINLTAQLEPDPSGIADVTLSYRLVGEYSDQSTDWAAVQMSEQGMQNEDLMFIAELPELGAEAMDIFDAGWGQLEYSLTAEDGAGNTSSWPANEPVAEFGVAPCPLVDVEILDGSLEPQFAEYGQAPGCEPSIAVFGLTLENAENLDEAWVDTRWYVGDFESGEYEPASPATKLSLLPAGPSGEHPGAVVFATNVDIQEGGQAHLQGENGFLAWRMRAKAQDGTVGEWPPGDAPPVFINACDNDEILAVPTNTPDGPIVVLPVATATPIGPIIVQPIATATQMGLAPQPTATTGIILIPGVLIQSSGEDLTVNHGQGFDLDSGQVVASNSPAADFVLAEGADPYLDDFDPVNGSYVGWAGFVDGSPSKSTCNILKTSSTMVVGWPDHQDSYYCFDTSEGNVAWLRLNTYVSQPFSERRLIFDYTTYQ